MIKFTVRLDIPMNAWALVEVTAANKKEAASKALALSAEGSVSCEYSRMDARDAEVVDVERAA